MKREGQETAILQKSKNFVKYHRLLQKAEEEGRLDGKFRCSLCGMRYLTAPEAEACCRIDG